MHESTISPEIYHKLYFEQSPDGIIVADDHGHLIDVNNAICDMLGFSRDEMLQMTVEALFFPEDLKIEPLQYKNVIKGEMIRKTRRMLTRNAHFIHAECNARVISSGFLLVFVRDISEKIMRERELKFHSMLLNNIQDKITATDLEGRIIFVNEAEVEMMGRSIDELIGQHVDIYGDNKKKGATQQDIIELTLRDGEWRGEVVNYRVDGKEVLIDCRTILIRDEKGLPQMMVSVGTDVTERRRVLDELRTEQQRLQTVIDATPDIICFKDAEGRWIKANKAILALFGLDEEGYRGKIESELIDPSVPVLQEMCQQCAASDELAWERGNTSKTLEKISDSEGHFHVFDVIKVPLYHCDGSRKGIVVFGRDITELKEAEEKIIQREEMFRQIAENTSDVIWTLNRDIEYTYVSPSIFKQRGYTPEEFIHLTSDQVYTPESMRKVYQMFKESIALADSGKMPHDFSVTITLDHICKDGSVRTSEVHTNPIFDAQRHAIGAHGVSRDITERVKADRALKESEARYRLIADNSQDVIWLWSLKQHKFDYISPAISLMKGISVDEAMGQTLYDAIPKSYHWLIHRELPRRVKALLSGNENERNTVFEVEQFGKNGAIIDTEVATTLVQDEKGEVTHIQGVVRDISMRKQVVKAMQMAKEAAEESSKLKTAFLNNISHEIRTPMNAILGFTELLGDPSYADEERKLFRAIITGNANQLMRIIDDVLELSRLDSGRLPLHVSACCLSDLLKEIYSTFQDQVRNKGLDFSFSIGEGPHSVQTDGLKIRQVLTGLLVNALKFTVKGSIEFGYTFTDDRVRFFVKDTGFGIKEADKEKVFDRFFTIRDDNATEIRGTGLGLSIAKGIVDIMEGKIWVDSCLGEGSTFFFDIPYQEDTFCEELHAEEQPVSLEDVSILIAEDDDNNFTFLNMVLARRVKGIWRAKDGREAVHMHALHSPNLILMDLKMPFIDGLEATRRIRERDKLVPVIALTAYTRPEEEANALASGCNAFASKPIRKEELLYTIKKLIFSSERIN